MNIYKTSKKIKKKYKGNTSIENLIAELESRGYCTVFFNTPKGDAALRAAGIVQPTANAFTVCGVTKNVFVSNSLSLTEKQQALAHELGHIALNHIGKNKNTYREPSETELEAHAFAHALLYSKSRSPLHVICAILICVLALVIGSFFAESKHTADVESVYITQAGNKFHRESCIYAKNKTNARLTRSEAEKCFEPCSVCNP